MAVFRLALHRFAFPAPLVGFSLRYPFPTCESPTVALTAVARSFFANTSSLWWAAVAWESPALPSNLSKVTSSTNTIPPLKVGQQPSARRG
jgi:hypothetical protein